MIPAGCVERCPACPHRDFSREESHRLKSDWAAAELAPWKSTIQPLIAAEKRWAYRRKTLQHARWSEGAWRFGIVRRKGRDEEFIPIPECPLHAPEVNRLYDFCTKLAPPELPLVFGLVSGTSLTLVLKSSRDERWVRELQGWEPGWPGSLLVNWNPAAGKRALDSKRTELLFGPLWQKSEGLWYGPSAFRQQIPEVEEKALILAKEFLQGAGISLVVDLYSGLGRTLQEWRALGWEAVGVELSGESLEAARKNAEGALLLRGRVEDRLPQLTELTSGRPFVTYANPPRSGLGEKVALWLREAGPERIAYLSCHPRSLKGDLSLLASAYEVEKLQLLDFFPQTSHLETLALLRKR